MVDALFRVSSLSVRPVSEGDHDATLSVYRECDDFLSLGPVPTASMGMVLADIDHSRKANGVFCGVFDATGRQIGVLDFVPEIRPGTASLALLMVARSHRNRGYGASIVDGLVAHLRSSYGTETIESGVQVNNPAAIRFWRRVGFVVGTEPRDMGDGTTAYETERKV